MATCLSVINRAYAMAGIIALGETVSAEELSAGLGVLQGIYDRLADARDYKPVYTTGAYAAKEGERITGATTVTLPATVVDDISGEDRSPADMAFIQYDIGSGMVTNLSDRGTWVATDELDQNDEAPLSGRNAEGFSALIALEIADTYPGAAIGPTTVRKARRFQTIFTREDAQPIEYF